MTFLNQTARTLKLTLPEPPSANTYWRHVGSKVLLSKDARDYRNAVKLAYAQQVKTLSIRFPTQPLGVTLVWFRSRKSGDLDNRIKQALDALAGLAYTNDAQIEIIIAIRRDDKDDPRLEVEITPR